MIKVIVFVNETPVAEATARNLSDLADMSDYEVRATEFGAQHLDIPSSEITGQITSHQRRTSVWRLVREIAEVAITENRKNGATMLLRGIADVQE